MKKLIGSIVLVTLCACGGAQLAELPASQLTLSVDQGASVDIVDTTGTCPDVAAGMTATLDGRALTELERGGIRSDFGTSCRSQSFFESSTPAIDGPVTVEVEQDGTKWTATFEGLCVTRSVKLQGAAYSGQRAVF